MSYNNLSKTFRYVNSEGAELIFNYDNGFLLNKPVGIDTLQISHSQSQGINQIGSSIQASNIQPRAISVSGRIVGSNQASKKDLLLAIIRPDLWGKLYADDYSIDVRPTSTPAVDWDMLFAKFVFSLLAPYPYFQRTVNSKTMLSGVEPAFRLPNDFSGSYRFGSPMAALFINVINRGQVAVPFTLEIKATAAVVNPKLLNAETGDFLLIEKAMVADERIVVEVTHDRTYVTSSVDGDIAGAVSLDSSLFSLAVGDNVLKPSAESGDDNMSMNITYATELVGITV